MEFVHRSALIGKQSTVITAAVGPGRVLILISYNKQALAEPTPDWKEVKSASSIAKIRLSMAALASVRLVEDVTSNRTCLLLSLICSEKGEGIEIPKCTVSNKKLARFWLWECCTIAIQLLHGITLCQ